jgi:hypothetical protein
VGAKEREWVQWYRVMGDGEGRQSRQSQLPILDQDHKVAGQLGVPLVAGTKLH